MWNYRVLKEEFEHNEKKLERFRVIEVYYDDQNVITGWVDCTHDILSVTNDDGVQAYDDLKGSAEHVLDAFKLPVVTMEEIEQLKIEGKTHWIDLVGSVELDENTDLDMFSDQFIDWLESNGWAFLGSFNPTEEDKDDVD